MRNDLDHKSWVCPEEKETPFSGEDMNKKSFLTCQCFNSSTKVRCLEKLPTYFLPQSTLSKYVMGCPPTSTGFRGPTYSSFMMYKN